MIRHKQEEAIINWLNEFKKRSEPFRINKAEIIFDPERFAEMNIERIKSAVSIQTYKNSLQEVTKVKKAFDSLI
jgi:hypothetical protein